jgi:hypothetical protein
MDDASIKNQDSNPDDGDLVSKTLGYALPLISASPDDLGVDFRRETSATLSQLFTALSIAQGAYVPPKKDKKVVVTTTRGGSYSYFYADLADMMESLRKPFFDNGLAIIQYPAKQERVMVDDVDQSGKAIKYAATKIEIRTAITHKSGEWISCGVSALSESESPQAIGSIITYLRRYGLGPLAGIASDRDDDGSLAQGNQPGGAGSDMAAALSGPKRTSSTGQDASGQWTSEEYVESYSAKPVTGGKTKHNIKLSVSGWASTLDDRMGKWLGAEAGTGMKISVRLKRAGQYTDILAAELVPPNQGDSLVEPA